MKVLLSCFAYEGSFYEIFSNENGEILYQKFGNQTKKTDDTSIIQTVLREIKKKKYVKMGDIHYHDERLHMYLNMFRPRVCFSKTNPDGTESVCDYDTYKALYDIQNGMIAYDGSIDESQSMNHGSTKKRKDSLAHKLKVLVAGVLVTVTVFTAGVSCAKLHQGGDIPVTEIPIETVMMDEEETQEEAVTGEEETQKVNVIDQIRQSLEGEEEWVIQQVIESFQEEHGILANEELPTEQSTVENENTESTKRFMEAIQNNSNLSEKDKETIIKYMPTHWNEISESLEPSSVDDLVEIFQTINISFAPDDFDGDIFGEYQRAENEVTIYTPFGQNAPMLHELIHAEGYLSGFSRIAEGYVEMNNPLRTPMTYQKNQIAVTMLSQVLGRETLASAFSNKSFFILDDALSEKLDDGEKANFLSYLCDVENYLGKYGSYDISDLKKVDTYIQDTKNLMEEMNKYYQLMTGKDSKDNEVLQVCGSMLLGEEYKGYNISDIYEDRDGVHYKVRKQVEYSDPITKETKQQDVSGTKDAR